MCSVPNDVVVDVRANEHYTMSVRANGLFSLSVKGEKVIDRGGLHEFIDLRKWRERVMDGQPVVTQDAPSPSVETPADHYRRAWHYLQYYNEANIANKENGWEISGVLATAEGEVGGMEYHTRIEIDDSRVINILVSRKYLEDYPTVGDNSLCFLSPGGFAKRFMVQTASEHPDRYGVRDDGKLWEPLTHSEGPVETQIPHRLRARIDGRGLGAIFGGEEGFGFGLIIDSFADATHPGQMRCTRPRPPAEQKFDEVEFQWGPGGKRSKVETAEFRLVACTNTSDVVNAFETCGE